MTAHAAGYFTGVLAMCAGLGMLVALAMRASAGRLPERAARRRRAAPLVGVLVAVAALALPALAAPARAQEAPVWSDEAVANLRGFGAECEERCAAQGGGGDCLLGCTCLGIQLSYTLDPATLEANGKVEPSQDDITAFVVANREAFANAYATCDVPIE